MRKARRYDDVLLRSILFCGAMILVAFEQDPLKRLGNVRAMAIDAECSACRAVAVREL